jgi:hypothetical protein
VRIQRRRHRVMHAEHRGPQLLVPSAHLQHGCCRAGSRRKSAPGWLPGRRRWPAHPAGPGGRRSRSRRPWCPCPPPRTVLPGGEGPGSRGRRAAIAWTRRANRSPGIRRGHRPPRRSAHTPRLLRPSKTMPTYASRRSPSTVAPRFSGLRHPIAGGSLSCAYTIEGAATITTLRDTDIVRGNAGLLSTDGEAKGCGRAVANGSRPWFVAQCGVPGRTFDDRTEEPRTCPAVPTPAATTPAAPT